MIVRDQDPLHSDVPVAGTMLIEQPAAIRLQIPYNTNWLSGGYPAKPLDFAGNVPTSARLSPSRQNIKAPQACSRPARTA
jgi:hypothetical protein